MSRLLIIFLTVFIDLLGFGIIIPLLPGHAVFARTTRSTSQSSTAISNRS